MENKNNRPSLADASKAQDDDAPKPSPVTNAAQSSDFLQSMTFANRSQHNAALFRCDCDECGVVGSSGQSFIPNAIQQALNDYKEQQKRSGVSFRRTQERTLVRKHSLQLSDDSFKLLSIWQWTLPQHAEPLLEFGNSHRIVYIQRLSGVLKQIGTGIVGSSHEEQGRKVLPWRVGDVYFVPSRQQGKAVGWILEAEDVAAAAVVEEEVVVVPSKKLKTTGSRRMPESRPAVLFMVKIPPETLSASDETHDNFWYNSVLSVCKGALKGREVDDNAEYWKVDEAGAKRIKDLCSG